MPYLFVCHVLSNLAESRSYGPKLMRKIPGPRICSLFFRVAKWLFFRQIATTFGTSQLWIFNFSIFIFHPKIFCPILTSQKMFPSNLSVHIHLMINSTITLGKTRTVPIDCILFVESFVHTYKTCTYTFWNFCNKCINRLSSSRWIECYDCLVCFSFM